MNYIVAAIGEWNKALFDEYVVKLSGNWAYVSTPTELKAKLATGFDPKYIFFLHWRWIVPVQILSEFECVCFHMTDVPYGRGGSPLQNLIVRGHKDTVLTALKMEKGLDTGPVYLKEAFNLAGSAEAIYNRASQTAWDMIKNIIANEPQPIPQQGDTVNFQRRTPKQSEIPNDLTVEQLYDYIRMLDAPGYPKAFIDKGSYQLEFDQAELATNTVTARVKIKLKDI
ncbi:probable methionyl-tRNA formyltransferase [Psychrobacter arcticus 273-4]|uniref:Probable methionyl-tRNA formyltransferase n=1 Tax=Psychrobacter arcticus (strain DSM 17307 / VKM B-2377 / 273-4) TaxID=259536 RepID=Q4FTZ0_PSYA2|nr:methionyl-tRNA formyltransferase [Psychrobacter arcticus]AAZ18518.1 probable methionyl-tRNA formyltransferase [Psychrobacter arcticus 273-4]